MASPESSLVPVFVGERGRNVTFVVESSEEMRAALGSVQRLLIHTLLSKASHRDSLFNIITFCSQLTCWSRLLLPCSPGSVFTSLSWIRSISCGPGRNLLGALSAALADPALHAVHLLLTALPDHAEAVLMALPALSAGRPVNTLFLLDAHAQLDARTRDFLQSLTQTSGGRCHLVLVGLNGVLEKALPLFAAVGSSCFPSSTFTCLSAPSPLLRCSLGNLRPATSCVASDLSQAEFFPGCKVLARKEADGFYYSGTLIKEVQGCGGVWQVDFDPPGGSGQGLVPPQRQLVCSQDLVDPSRAQTEGLSPGAPVLAPWGSSLSRYGPGRVMLPPQDRDASGSLGAVRCGRVLMWDGSVSLVPCSLVSPISAPQHQKILRELRVLKPAALRGCCVCSCSASCCQLSSSTRRFSCGGTDGSNRTEQDAQVELRDTGESRDADRPCSSCSSSSSCSCSSSSELRAVKVRSKQQRPPWRYWRRTGPEPQHRKPGGAAVPKRMSLPVRFSFPAPQLSTSPNHSSLFQSLSDAGGRRANIRDVFGFTNFKPRPPTGARATSANNTATLHT